MQCGPFYTIDSSDRETVTGEGEGGTDDILAQTVYGELGYSYIHVTNVVSLLYSRPAVDLHCLGFINITVYM